MKGYINMFYSTRAILTYFSCEAKFDLLTFHLLFHIKSKMTSSLQRSEEVDLVIFFGKHKSTGKFIRVI